MKYTSSHSGANIDKGVTKSLANNPKSFISVDTLLDRDAISAEDKTSGKIVYVTETDKFYKWASGVWAEKRLAAMNIFTSQLSPSDDEGVDGDIWFRYTV